MKSDPIIIFLTDNFSINISFINWAGSKDDKCLSNEKSTKISKPKLSNIFFLYEDVIILKGSFIVEKYSLGCGLKLNC